MQVRSQLRESGEARRVAREARQCSEMLPAERIAGDAQQHLSVGDALGPSSADDRPASWSSISDGILKGPPLSVPLPDESLGVVLLRRLREHGERVALVDAASETETTYQKLLHECVSLACGLRTLVNTVPLEPTASAADPPPDLIGPGAKGSKARRFAGGSRNRPPGPPADWSKVLRGKMGLNEGLIVDAARVDPPRDLDETDMPLEQDHQEERVVIGLLAENRKEVVLTLVASLIVGVPVTTLNPLSNTGELVRAWSMTNPSLALCSWDTFHAVLEASRSLPSLRHIVVFPGDVPEDVKQAAATDRTWDVQVSHLEQLMQDTSDGDAEVDLEAVLRELAVPLRPAEHTAFLLHCNTGSRIARLTHRNFLYAVQLMQEPPTAAGYGWTKEDIVLLPAPLTHAFGLGICLGSLALGAKVVLMSAFREQQLISYASTLNVTQLVMVPSQTSLLAHSPLLDGVGLPGRGLRGLAGALCAAAPLPRALCRDLERRLQMQTGDGGGVRQAYGLTQAACSLVIAPRGTPPDAQGRLVPGAQAKVVDAAGRVVPPLHVGELHLRAPSVMAGYYLDEEATREALDDQGWLRTGDLAYYDQNGFLFVVDRVKDVMLYTRVHFKQFDQVEDGEESQPKER